MMEICLEPRPSKVGAASYLGHLGQEAWGLVAREAKSLSRNHISHRTGKFTVPRESVIPQDFFQKRWKPEDFSNKWLEKEENTTLTIIMMSYI